MGWLGGNFTNKYNDTLWLKYTVKIRHRGLQFWAYSPYQVELSDLVIKLKDSGGQTYKSIATILKKKGYKSPRGMPLDSKIVFSIYKKRKARDIRLSSKPEVMITDIRIEQGS